MRISDWSSDVCSSDLWRSQGFFSGESAVQMRLIRGAEPNEFEQEAEVDDRQNGTNSPRKRVRFSEPPRNTKQDLLNDLDDDDEGEAQQQAASKPSLAERQAHTQWHSSDAITFERFR